MPPKPEGEKPPDPNGECGNTGAHAGSPAPNQEVRAHGGQPRDNGEPETGSAAAGLGNKGAASANPSYANMLKTNIKFDQRLKRNVLEVHIEKNDKFDQVELGGDTMVRILKSIGMNVTTELEGSFVVYGNTPVIIMLCKADVNLENFCLSKRTLPSPRT